MSKILYIKASPRTQRSKSMQAAEGFLDAYRAEHPEDEIAVIDLFVKNLPPLHGPALDAKYAILHGEQPTSEQKAAWTAVEAVIEEFKSADKFVFAVPMWNFGIPYCLKHYFDVIVQPTYTFRFSPEEGYSGMLNEHKALVIGARGGDYSEPDAQALDMQKPYLDLILGFMGISDVTSVIVQPTLAAGPDIGAEKLDAAKKELTELAKTF